MLHRSVLTLVTLLSLSAVHLTLAPPELGDVQKVKEWGYSIRPIKGWKSQTVEAGTKNVVGCWIPDLSELERRGAYDQYREASVATLRIVRVEIPTSGTAGSKPEASADTKPDAKPELPAGVPNAVRKALEGEKVHTSVEAWIESEWEGASKRYTKKDVKAPMKGWTAEWGAGAQTISVGVFSENNIEWGVIYTAFEETYKKNWAEVYKKSIASFKLFPPEGKPSAGLLNKDPTKLDGQAKRDAVRASIAGNPGWYAVDTPNYVFLTDDADKGFISELTKQIEIIRAKVYEKMFPPLKPITEISTVRVFSNQADYHAYGGPGGSAGYWNSRKEELVLFTRFTGESKKNSKDYCKSVMYHEAFHQYIFYAAGDLAPHSWFNEGHGDYFAGATISSGNVRIDTFDWRVGHLKDHMSKGNDLIPIKSLVRYPQSEYYTNGGFKYAQGWAMVYFLRKVTKNKRWQEIPDRYYNKLVAGMVEIHKAADEKDAKDGLTDEQKQERRALRLVGDEAEKVLDAAVDEAFKDVDFAALDKEFAAFVKTLN
jgi:hypothetical protein